MVRACLSGRVRYLLVTNHQSMIDSFLLGIVLFFPRVLWYWRDPPFHLADGRNFGKHPFLGIFYDALRAIPVDRTKQDMQAYKAAVKALQNGRVLCVFPEGGRERPGEFLRPLQPKALTYALAVATPVLICAFHGMHDVQRYATNPLDDPVWWRRIVRHTSWLTSFRWGKRIGFVYGPLLTAEEVRKIAGDGTRAEQRERLTQYVEQVLRSLKEETERLVRHSAP
ncbi:MAG: lysophospholipid acyltransferase family protein [Candidatus Kerfeldbacteria bacterium]